MEETVSRDQIVAAFSRYLEARSDLLDLGADKCEEINQAPNLANIWTVVLQEACGANAGEQAMQLVAGLDHAAEVLSRNIFLEGLNPPSEE